MKSDNRMDRCWPQGALDDALHAISCGAGYNLRWLVRAFARLNLESLFLRLRHAVLRQGHGHLRPSGAYASAS